MSQFSLRFQPVYDALERSGFKMPSNVARITIDEANENVTAVHFECFLDKDQLSKFGEALAEIMKEQT